jgi:hypothetical protein
VALAKPAKDGFDAVGGTEISPLRFGATLKKKIKRKNYNLFLLM